MKTSALLVTAKNHISLGEVHLPDPAAGEVLVKAAFTSISPGTELRCMRGEQDGLPAYPFIPGYSLVGTVAAAGAGVTLAIGARVFCGGTSKANVNTCWGAHIAHALQTEADLIPLPDDVPLEAAALCRLAAIAYRGVRLSRPLPHESVVVIGLGPIGMFSARLFHAAGARVLGVDRLAERVRLLQAQGVQAVVLEDRLEAAVKRVFPAGADVVVDATGAAPVALEIGALGKDLPWDDTIAPSTRFVIQGSYPTHLTLDYRDVFSKEATVLFPRHHKPADLRAVLDLLRRNRLEVADIIHGIYKPADAPAIYTQLREQPASIMTALFKWN